jgi:hypothetical protein
MLTLMRREVAAVLLAGVASAALGAPVTLPPVEKPLSPETIVEKDFTGKATVEFTVGEVTLRPTSWSITADAHWRAVPMTIVAKAADMKIRVGVLLAGEVVERLRRLGIDNPTEHFQGKVLRVSGTVEHFWIRSGLEYRIQVNSLDQLEEVRKPKKVPHGETDAATGEPPVAT